MIALLAYSYVFLATILLCYGLNCYWMTFLYLYHFKNRPQATPINDPLTYSVTTQIPVYNENNVIERVVQAVCAMDWPKSHHQIQILDDSTDETSVALKKMCLHYKSLGYDIHHIQRTERTGFKAGALANGLARATGEYVAIFDTDFVPEPDYLINTVSFLTQNKDLGLIQTRWEHLNQTSLFARLQGIGIDGHFAVEQGARAWSHLFMNFNGTAGVFRKQAILDAGGWECDTLTEDMDLSYRMQLNGWKAQYLLDITVPSELPQSMQAFKNQQFRWAKGSIETARKIIPKMLLFPCPLHKKIQAIFHLTHYLIHPLMLFLSVFALPLILYFQNPLPTNLVLSSFTVIFLAFFGPNLLYTVSQKTLDRNWVSTVLHLPLLSIMGTGLALNNSMAVFQALCGKKSPFVRTPKAGETLQTIYVAKGSFLCLLEILLGLWCAFSLYQYYQSNHLIATPFLAIYTLGYLVIGGTSLFELITNHLKSSAQKRKPVKEDIV
jgi:cellulose synthase/poly-beta-1,6-N-acetylglucosamine synthase-like glycosyltransferase